MNSRAEVLEPLYLFKVTPEAPPKRAPRANSPPTTFVWENPSIEQMSSIMAVATSILFFIPLNIKKLNHDEPGQ
jgi:hypothetical protein